MKLSSQARQSFIDAVHRRYEANDWNAASHLFRTTCARAFAGTRWKPVEFRSYGRAGARFDVLVVELHLQSDFPLGEMFPRAAFARDPRFYLRGQHPKRGRYQRG